MAEEVQLYSAIDQVNDALERVLVDSVANLERYIQCETDPAKIAFINEKIITSMDKLQSLKEKREGSKKQSAVGVFDKVMTQLGSSPKLASKIEKHDRLKALMAQIEEAKINEDEQDDSIQRNKPKQLGNE